MKREMDKKGQNLTLGTIILILLGLVVLVFLIYGFSSGWSNLWERVTGLGGGDVNADTIRTSCVLACQQDNRHGFCDQKRSVVLEAGEASEDMNCRQFIEETSDEAIGKGCPGLCN